MRLITFQSVDILKKVLDNGVARQYYSGNSRLKEIDKDYITKHDGEEYMPFYCFATIRGETMSLRTIGNNWDYLKGWMNFKNGVVMLELEVPETDILSMKDEYVFKQFDGTIYRSCYQRVVNDTVSRDQKTFEVLISKIKLEYLVAYRTYDNNPKYGCVEVYTTVVNDELCPLWVSDVVLCGDGYIRDYKKYAELKNSDKEDEIRFGYAIYPDSIEVNFNYMLPDKCSKKYNLIDCLCYLLSYEASKNWIEKYMPKGSTFKDVIDYCKKQYNAPGFGVSMKDAEELLR